MTDQFDGKGPYVERLDLVDDSLGAYNNPRCSLDVRVEMNKFRKYKETWALGFSPRFDGTWWH